jgi:hypothetical protein
MECEKCIFYLHNIHGKQCTKIRNYNVQKKKTYKVDLSFGQKVCKGYFFEHKDSDLYSTKDASLSGESHPN